MTAFEELKVWCAKHLSPEQFTIFPETESFLTTIYFNSRNDVGMADYICFDNDGNYRGAGAISYESKIEHCDEYEQQDSATAGDNWFPNDSEPVLTPIGGMMVRKMIEEYERKMKQ